MMRELTFIGRHGLIKIGDKNYFEIGLKIYLNVCFAECSQVSAWVPRAKVSALPV
jgi:hypothetical protein